MFTDIREVSTASTSMPLPEANTPMCGHVQNILEVGTRYAPPRSLHRLPRRFTGLHASAQTHQSLTEIGILTQPVGEGRKAPSASITEAYPSPLSRDTSRGLDLIRAKKDCSHQSYIKLPLSFQGVLCLRQSPSPGYQNPKDAQVCYFKMI